MPPFLKRFLAAALAVAALAPAAWSAEISLYTSVDEPYFTPLLQRFEKQTGIHVRVLTDGEASKTTGLAEKLLAERNHPRADVYWGNEVFHTINLADQNCFAPYTPPGAQDIPSRFTNPQHLWTAIGLRARMLATAPNTPHVHSLNDLTAPSLKNKIAIANPAFGTSSGHMAALYLIWGKPAFQKWLEGLRANNVVLLGGNSAVVTQITAGNIVAGLTDNDDIATAVADGQPVEQHVPDQGPDGKGTLLIPTTIALVRNAPDAADAEKLIDFLTTPAVENELLTAHFLAFSVRHAETVKSLEVDYAACAKIMKEAIETTLSILQRR